VSAPPFVGRSAELAQLLAWTAEASTGEPRLVLLRGEAGMGKSRLLNELARQLPSDALALIGSCQEDLAVPYMPIADALRPLLEWPTGRRTAAPEQDDYDDRLALFLRVTQAVTDEAEARTVVLLLDDAHWADPASGKLLAHLVATAAIEASRRPLRLTIVAALRPTIADAVLSRSIERFEREPMARQMHLSGLDELGLNELIESRMGMRPSRQLVHDLHGASGGNPLLALSLLERLDAFGALTVRDERLVHTTDAEPLGLPAGLDSVLRDRIESVSPSCRRLLLFASFLGDDIDLERLRTVSRSGQEVLDTFVDEAVTAGVLTSDEQGVRFAHPQLRQLLYHEPRGRRRAALHRQIADQLEATYGDGDEIVPVIAHHLRRAGADIDPDRLTRHALAAAAISASLGAWEDTWRLYEAALGATSSSATFPSAFRALIHHRAAVAAWNDHDNARAIAHADQAVTHARALGDLERWAPAAVLGARIRVVSGVEALGARIDREPLESFLAAAGDAVPRLRALAYAQLAELDNHENQPANGLDSARRAWELADGDRATERAIVASVAIVHLGTLDLREAERWYERGAVEPPAGADPLPEVWSTVRLGLTRWALGRLDEAESVLGDAIDLAHRAQKVANEALATACLAGIATARGDYEAAESHGARCALLWRWSDYGFAPAMLFPTLAAGRAVRGDRAGAHAALDELERAGGRGVWRYRYLVDIRCGAADEVRAAATARPVPRPQARSLGLYDLGNVGATIELAVFFRNADLVVPLVEPLELAAGRGLACNPGWPFDVGDLLAAAHGLLDG
jgi:hypothetical protein